MDFLEKLANSRFRANKPYAEPELIAQKPPAGPFYFRELAASLPLGVDTIGENYAPASPVRRDPYDQGTLQKYGANVNGSAPTEGIYTGVGDYE